MASKDYDDLLESFMNNSQKVYNEDKDIQKKKGDALPSSYSVNGADKNKPKKNKKNKSPKPKKSPVAKFFASLGKAILALIMVFGVVAVVCASVIGIYGYSVVHGDAVFDLDKEKYSQNQTSFLYGYKDAKKKNIVEIARLHGEENRVWINLDDINEYLPQAFIAIEDERFETHHGVDWKRVGGVILVSRNAGQGGSTITQQLIKNLTDENDVTFVRKFNEILSALNLEKHYSKDEIIEAYLNTIYLSHGCYGVKTAAETYFGKDVEDLNIAECACLAGITQYPSKYDPLIHPDNNRTRQLWILKKMNSLGYISDAEYLEAKNYEMVFTNSKNYKGSQVKEDKNVSKDKAKINSYYTDYVIEEVIKDLQKMGYSSKKAKNMIYGGGLKIYCAVDFDVQSAIEDVYVNYKKMPDKSVQGACVVMDYKGRILGIVGGTGKKKANRVLNRASQSKRQPGSTIKPLSVYSPALEKSLNDPNTDIFWSTPTPDKPLMRLSNGKMWPTNEGGGFSGKNVSVQVGLAKSMNTISAQTLDKIGPSYSYDYISNRYHISTLDVIDEDYAPMATGSLTNGVTPLEMTTAYQAFGNGGYYYESYSYYKIEDSLGNVIIEKDPEGSKETAISEGTAGIMNKMLQTVMTQGTGTTYKLSNIQCFGKTGTTTENKDRWFIGGTPEYVGGVWYGYDTPKEVHYYLSPNPCGTIWNLVMKNIYEKKGVNKREFPTPECIVHREYSPENGKLCSGSGVYGWFDKNNLPGRTTYVPTTEETTTDKNETTTKKAEKTTSAQTTAPQTTEAQTTASSGDGND
jgi:penicillin-binding protein 1A